MERGKDFAKSAGKNPSRLYSSTRILVIAMPASIQVDRFLSNYKSKLRFISILRLFLDDLSRWNDSDYEKWRQLRENPPS